MAQVPADAQPEAAAERVGQLGRAQHRQRAVERVKRRDVRFPGPPGRERFTMETGKIALLVGVVVLALGILVFVIYRSNSSSSGTVQTGEIKHVTAAARERR